MQRFFEHWLPTTAQRLSAAFLLAALLVYAAAVPRLSGPALYEIWHHAGGVIADHAARGDFDYAHLKPEGQNFYKLSPAFTLMPMWFLARLPQDIACALFNMLNVLCMAAGLVAFLTRVKPSFRIGLGFSILLCFLALFDLNINAKYGQVTGILAGCMLGGLAAFSAKRFVLAGLLLAYASNVKLYPLVVALLLCTALRPRFLLSFLGFLAFFYLAPALFLGWNANLEFHKSLFNLLLKEGNYQYHFTEIHHHYSLRAFLQADFGVMPGPVLTGVSAAVALFLAAAWFLRFRRSPDLSGSGLSMFLLAAFPFILLFNTRTEGPATVLMGPLYVLLLTQGASLSPGWPRRLFLAAVGLGIFTLSFSITDLGKALHVNRFFWDHNLRTLPVLLLMVASMLALASPAWQEKLSGSILASGKGPAGADS